jgi:hypothetical protein
MKFILDVATIVVGDRNPDAVAASILNYLCHSESGEVFGVWSFDGCEPQRPARGEVQTGEHGGVEAIAWESRLGPEGPAG